MSSRPHAMHFNAKLGRHVCDKCGLVALKNTASRKAVQAACPGSEES